VSIAFCAIRTRNRLDRLILLIPYWESHRADPEEKQGPASDIRHRSGKTARKRLTLNRRIEKGACIGGKGGSGGRLQPIPPTRDSLVLLQIELKSYTLVLYTFQFPAFVWMMMVGRLSEFPWVIVRVDCPLCPHRRGQYRLARLVEKFGADIQLSELLDRIAFDCPRKSHPWEQPPNECDPKCKARFTDLEATSRPPPDLPPAMRKLTVILGGKS
jgi:hypothetical protein